MKKLLLTSLLLTATVTLAACQQLSEILPQEQMIETTVTETTVAETTATTSTSDSQEGTTVASGLDVEAIANLDFSSVEGTYLADGGEFIISGQTISFNKEDGVFPTDARSGVVINGVAKIATNSAFYYFIPAGVTSPEEFPDVLGEEDINRDRVVVSGNGMNLFYLD